MHRVSFVALLALLSACQSKADIVIEGGPVWTGLSTGRGQLGAVAIAGDKIVAVGDSAQIARYIGSKTRILRAQGGLIMPGFADSHTHFVDGGFQLASIDLRNAASPQEFVRRIKDYAAHLKAGEWILGGDWDHTLWPGSPLPRRDFLRKYYDVPLENAGKFFEWRRYLYLNVLGWEPEPVTIKDWPREIAVPDQLAA